MKTLCLISLCVSGLAAEPPPEAQPVREVVTNWNQIGSLRLGTNSFEVMQGSIFTNYVLRSRFEGRVAELVLKSDPGPVLTNWCDLAFIPTAGPGPAWTIKPPLMPLPTKLK